MSVAAYYRMASQYQMDGKNCQVIVSRNAHVKIMNIFADRIIAISQAINAWLTLLESPTVVQIDPAAGQTVIRMNVLDLTVDQINQIHRFVMDLIVIQLRQFALEIIAHQNRALDQIVQINLMAVLVQIVQLHHPVQGPIVAQSLILNRALVIIAQNLIRILAPVRIARIQNHLVAALVQIVRLHHPV